MDEFTLWVGDLSLETLRMIKRDLSRYSSLKAYEKSYKELCEYLEIREKEGK